MDTQYGMRNDQLFIYDLELPESFIPTSTDGEVAEFRLLHAETMLQNMYDVENFKFNSGMVMLDFLLRHGVIKPTHPEYAVLNDFMNQAGNKAASA